MCVGDYRCVCVTIYMCVRERERETIDVCVREKESMHLLVASIFVIVHMM